jgi:hypothetical protein
MKKTIFEKDGSLNHRLIARVTDLLFSNIHDRLPLVSYFTITNELCRRKHVQMNIERVLNFLSTIIFLTRRPEHVPEDKFLNVDEIKRN